MSSTGCNLMSEPLLKLQCVHTYTLPAAMHCCDTALVEYACVQQVQTQRLKANFVNTCSVVLTAALYIWLCACLQRRLVHVDQPTLLSYTS